MRIKPEAVRHLYSSLVVTYPFTKWPMPLPEEIDFQIVHDDELMGSYLLDSGDDNYEHTITISSARCAFYSTLLSTLCHEMIHCSFHKQKGDKWLQHGKPFRTRCSLVGKEIGLDPLEL
jgi:hypothetical protein